MQVRMRLFERKLPSVEQTTQHLCTHTENCRSYVSTGRRTDNENVKERRKRKRNGRRPFQFQNGGRT